MTLFLPLKYLYRPKNTKSIRNSHFCQVIIELVSMHFKLSISPNEAVVVDWVWAIRINFDNLKLFKLEV